MRKTPKPAAAPASDNPHRDDPEYGVQREKQQIAQAGAEARLKAARCMSIDWDKAPEWAGAYLLLQRSDGHRAYWGEETGGMMIEAPAFFDAGPNEDVRILKRECSAVRTLEAMGGEQPSGDTAVEARIPDKRPGENPHSHNVSGYRTMDDADVATINALKAQERNIGVMIREVRARGGDPRCVAIAMSRFEEAFMFAVKAVAKPADPYQQARADSGILGVRS